MSLEDLLEELVGEITDEYDVEEPEMVELGDGIYRVSGKTSIDDLNEMLEVKLPDEEWDTVGGLVLDIFGKIPDAGDEQPSSRGCGSAPTRCRAGASPPS